MKRRTFLLMVLLLCVPVFSLAAPPGFMKARMGTLSGQVVTEDGKPVPGGVVSFFDTSKGIPPLVVDMHRIPDMVSRLGTDGKFTVKLLPGSYYLGAMIIKDPGRGPGPPKKGETFYFARDDKGQLLKLTIKKQETKDAGKIIGALPDSFPVAKNLLTIEGRLIKDDGTPYVGGVVLVKTDMNKSRPDFVSQPTGKDGKFTLKLPSDTPYYLLGRERAVGRPVPGSYVGTYGSNNPISAGGALPIGGARPAQPASGMPNIEGVTPGPGDEKPATVTGKAGETVSGVDIKMFKVPSPGEQREKLQGTLGFGEEYKQKMDKIVPLLEKPAKK